MTIKFSPQLITAFFQRRSRTITSVVLVLGLLWLGYFLYQNVYTVVIQPAEIDKNEIVAKRQKVNLGLFSEVKEDIIHKGVVNVQTLQQLKNPFE